VRTIVGFVASVVILALPMLVGGCGSPPHAVAHTTELPCTARACVLLDSTVRRLGFPTLEVGKYHGGLVSWRYGCPRRDTSVLVDIAMARLSRAQDESNIGGVSTIYVVLRTFQRPEGSGSRRISFNRKPVLVLAFFAQSIHPDKPQIRSDCRLHVRLTAFR